MPSIVALVKLVTHDISHWLHNCRWTDDLEFIGEFVSATEEQPERGLIVPQSWFESQTHGPHNPFGDVYRGTVISTFHGPIHTLPSLPPALLSNANPILAQQTMVVKTFLVRFNDNPDAAWQCGVRSSSRTRHCFRIAVLRRVPEIVAVDEPAMSLEEIAALTSTPFRIISARRLSSQHLLQNDRLKSRTFESKSECSSKREASSDDAETDELPDDA